MKRRLLTMAVTVVLATLAMVVMAAPNYVSDGGRVAWSNGSGADVASGDVVDVGARWGIAGTAIATNAVGTVFTEGVWSVPLAANVGISLDEKVYWSAATTAATDVATTATFLGLAAEAVSSTSVVSKVKVQLTPPIRGAITTVATSAQTRTYTNVTVVTPQTVTLTYMPDAVTTQTMVVVTNVVVTTDVQVPATNVARSAVGY